MKNAIILHGTSNNSQGNWFPWLKEELENAGWQVYVPDLPHADVPNSKRYNEFLRSQEAFHVDNDTVLIGHSSGALAVMGILQELPEEVVVSHAVLVSAFTTDLGWDSLKEIAATPFDYEKIKNHARKITMLNGEKDPYIPQDEPKELANKLDAELITLIDQGHFSSGDDPKYKEFPYLFELITQTDENNND